MKQLFYATFVFSILLLGCKTNSLNGIYVCDQSKKKSDTTIQHDTYDELTFDLTCLVEEYNFKGNTTVSLKMKNGEIHSSYIIDKQYIRIKSDNSDILLEMKDDNTLISEGIFGGIYHKK